MKKGEWRSWLMGAGIGAANAIFGGGGGMIVVPILMLLMNLKAKESHATAILIILPITIISAVIYLINGYFSLDSGVSSSIGVIVGGILGALLLKKISNKWIVKIFAIVMVIGGVKMLFF